jgi:hypothetical protein
MEVSDQLTALAALSSGKELLESVRQEAKRHFTDRYGSRIMK